MKRRKLGNAGLEVSELGLGCMGMSWAYGTPDRAQAIATIHRAVALGVDFFDTAELYGPYTNEELLGDALVGRREEVLIATKFGFNLVDGAVRGVNSHPRQIRKVCDESLKRLKTDRIDRSLLSAPGRSRYTNRRSGWHRR